MKRKIFEWIRRYLPREIAGTVTAFAFAYVAWKWTGNKVLIAIAGTWGENAGFYGVSIYHEASHHLSKHRHHHIFRRCMLIAWKTVRNIVLEFGPSEILDSFLLRPFFMYIFQFWGFGYGIICGKLTADLVFYGIAITSFELRKRLIGE